MPDLTDLIERLEKATEGSQELDADVALAAGYECANYPNRMWWRAPGGDWTISVPAFTTSLDAALSLVPEGWQLRKLSEQDDGWYCTLTRLGTHPTGNDTASPIKSAALAVCAAALKARQAAS